MEIEQILKTLNLLQEVNGKILEQMEIQQKNVKSLIDRSNNVDERLSVMGKTIDVLSDSINIQRQGIEILRQGIETTSQINDILIKRIERLEQS